MLGGDDAGASALMLHHVGIEIAPADLERAVEFWQLLGFSLLEPPAALADAFTWLEREGTQIHLMHTEAPSVPARGHVAVVAPDFERTVAGLRERGFELRPGREHWGAPRVHALAPGGHRVELMAAPPPAA
ncbi:MAG TPA: VOC family protein [Solirubrobacterales bacterium]|nr:VOC family protein [Solirubrobacterales bacterium]